VGRQYAGILGSIALVTSVLRGLVDGTATERVLTAAGISFLVFSVVGYVVGELAGWIVLTSVREKFAAEMGRPDEVSRRMSALAG
jgi:hypothetical protein